MCKLMRGSVERVQTCFTKTFFSPWKIHYTHNQHTHQPPTSIGALSSDHSDQLDCLLCLLPQKRKKSPV